MSKWGQLFICSTHCFRNNHFCSFLSGKIAKGQSDRVERMYKYQILSHILNWSQVWVLTGPLYHRDMFWSKPFHWRMNLHPGLMSLVAPGSFIWFLSTQTSSKSPRHDAATTVFCPLGDATLVRFLLPKKNKKKTPHWDNPWCLVCRIKSWWKF